MQLPLDVANVFTGHVVGPHICVKYQIWGPDPDYHKRATSLEKGNGFVIVVFVIINYN